MMNTIKLVCNECGSEYEPNINPTLCIKCNEPLNLKIENKDLNYDKKLPGIYKYIPTNLFNKKIIKSLGEGDTPIVKINSVIFKLDYLNPTGSFKDRGAAIATEKAYEFGYKEVVEDSSGNAAASITNYSKLYGLNPHIFMPKDAPINKKKYIKLLGGRLHLENDRGSAFKSAISYAKEKNYYYIGHLINPFFNIGLESIAHELVYQIEYIDNIIVPLGSGGLYLGIYNGFKKLIELDRIDYMPRLHAIEVEGYIRLKEIRSSTRMSKLGDGVRVPGPPRKQEILNAIQDSNGYTEWVNDEEIALALKDLIKYGFIVEPTSAVAYAGYKKLVSKGVLDKSDNTIIVLTGNGLKMINELIKILNKV